MIWMHHAGAPGRYQPLDDDGIKQVHETSLRVLSEVGISVPDPETAEVFRQAGAHVDDELNVARIPPEVIAEKVKSAPTEVRLCGRDGRCDLDIQDGNVYLGTGGTALNILDFDSGEKRTAKIGDLVDVARLVDSLENVDFLLLPTYPNELPVEEVDVNRFYTGLLYTGKHVMGGVYTREGASRVIRMAERMAGSAESLRERPFISMITCMTSPLKPDPHYTRLMVDIAREGIPVAVPAEPLCGATGPVTIAGNLVMQNVDSLTGVVLAQTANPGTPVIYGSVASSTNLKNMGYLCGSVEMGLLNAAGAQLASFYGLPYYATAGATDSKTVDVQCAYESAITSIMAALAGAHYIHDAAGLMEFAMTVSLEKYVIDNEILGMVMRAVEGIRITPESLAFDVIKEAGPGGDFISKNHTVKNMRKEHYIPTLSDRLDREEWEKSGAKNTLARARATVRRILDSDVKEYLSPAIKAELKSEFPEIAV
ncbi:MAG: trimethylamine methyltransferase family protein [Actinobacteria bacterium]|nr:trimethylamine methyltransferase family protein [Actinomycetota bacterium]MBU4219864.1 trimethylamine methyltransferase family protein [Actinomycetota bacterium]MBU4358847.1 trimethylamine methyltransferase family protein [Actinomycetota bacterium]MCG2820030.1 trimethylamine methyltransferase family protein [Actinomycetes bacterium]